MINPLRILCVILVVRSVTEVEGRKCRRFERITDNLREVVIGKCEFFQNTINQDLFCKYGFRNCVDIWYKFSKAFMYRPLCDVPDSRYTDYIHFTNHPVPRDKSIFWENVYPFIHRYSNYGHKFYSLSDTLTGYIGNGLNWCSDPNTLNGLAVPGTLCPAWMPTPDCPSSALYGFWKAASRGFAEKASGHVHIMLNANTVPIYANNTYFAGYELPYLRTGVVTNVTVLLVNESPEQFRSKCDDPSLQILADELKQKNFTYECIENERDVAELLCMEDSSLPLCKMLSQAPFLPSVFVG